MNFSKSFICKSFLLITLFSFSFGQVFSKEAVKDNLTTKEAKAEKQKLPKEQYELIVKTLLKNKVATKENVSKFKKELKLIAGSMALVMIPASLYSVFGPGLSSSIIAFLVCPVAPVAHMLGSDLSLDTNFIAEREGESYHNRLAREGLNTFGKIWGVWLLSTVSSYLILKFFSNYLPARRDKKGIPVKSLEGIMARWEVLRSKASEDLKDFLEPVYAKYLANNCSLNLTREEAETVIEDAVKICLTQKVQA